MGRRGRRGSKQGRRRMPPLKYGSSDDSDDDYLIEEDEEDQVSNGSEASFIGDDESQDEFRVLEDENEEEEVREVSRSRAKIEFSRQRKVGSSRSSRRRKTTPFDDEEDEDYNYECDYDTDDEEFSPGDAYVDDDEEESLMNKKIARKGTNKVVRRGLQKKRSAKGRRRTDKVVRRGLQKKGHAKGRKRKRSSRVLGKASVKKKRSLCPRKKVRYNNDALDDDFIAKGSVSREKKRTRLGKSRILAIPSDTDSGSSNFEFTISEEEREQVKEANEFIMRLTTSLRNSPSSRKLQACKMSKQKLEMVRDEVVKRVCGICLSEEGKRTVPGTLDCCLHFFCFVCIMEWSKVESRCPLCKHRFMTISRPPRSNTGINRRNVVIQIPERDQVYQPSAEEIRGFLDPYENVTCTECHQGGDDHLMLLCDLCDSPAHTYCVGLGRIVPEGDWYCHGCCRAFPLPSPNSLPQDSQLDKVTTDNITHRTPPCDTEFSGPNLSSPPFPQQFGLTSSPRIPVDNVRPASPPSGAGASTLSVRRQLNRYIHSLLSRNYNNNQTRQFDGRNGGLLEVNSRDDLLTSQVNRTASTLQNTRTPEARASYYNFMEERRLPEQNGHSQASQDPAPVSNHIF